jgi:exopolysaccharide biosynthesis predicted pyruvyltransferase EpsI
VSDPMREFVMGLRSRLFSILKTVLPIEPPVALVDVPNHSNVGDSAIYLGELSWMRDAQVTPEYVCDVYSYRQAELRARVPRGTILIHGGGNLGDLWPQQQALREQILIAFPEHRVIQLPQTIHFESQETLENAAPLFSGHRNLTVFVRDRVSLKLAETGLRCRAVLCPDTAFALGSFARACSATEDTVVLARTDKESAGGSPLEGVPAVDWLGDPPSGLLGLERWLRRHDMGLAVRQWLRRPLAEQRLRRGCLMLSRGRIVVTDRLHAHILCLLMGIPHILVDNNYGKVRSFFDAWTKDAPGVRFCRDWSEANTSLIAMRASEQTAGQYL